MVKDLAIAPNETIDRRGRRRWMLGTITGFALIVVLLVQAVAGFPGPGVLRRYGLADLNRVADRFNVEVPAPHARVDLLRSRVVLETTDHLAACVPKDLVPDMAMMVTEEGSPAEYCSGEPG